MKRKVPGERNLLISWTINSMCVCFWTRLTGEAIWMLMKVLTSRAKLSSRHLVYFRFPFDSFLFVTFRKLARTTNKISFKFPVAFDIRRFLPGHKTQHKRESKTKVHEKKRKEVSHSVPECTDCVSNESLASKRIQTEPGMRCGHSDYQQVSWRLKSTAWRCVSCSLH